MATKKPAENDNFTAEISGSKEEMLAEIERLKAALNAVHEKTTDDSAYNGDELVDYMAPIIGAGDQEMKPLFVCVNGESCAIKPGVPVRVKRKILDTLEHANDQRLAAWKYMQEQQSRGRKALSEM